MKNKVIQSLANAYRSNEFVSELPFIPQSDEEAWDIAEGVVQELGLEVGSYKIGAPTPDSNPCCGAILKKDVYTSGATIKIIKDRLIGIEGELAYEFNQDLPDIGRAYETADIEKSIKSVHLVLENIASRYEDRAKMPFLAQQADNLNSGYLVLGDEISDWQSIIPLEQEAKMLINDEVFYEGKSTSTAGDVFWLLVWFANHRVKRGNPIKKGEIITTGSATGCAWQSGNTTARVDFQGLGTVSARFTLSSIY